MASGAPKKILRGERLQPLLDTTAFDQWRTVVGSRLGEHNSDLLSPSAEFSAHMRFGSAGSLAMLHLLGSGAIQLHRVQAAGQAVLWIPLQGLSQEVVNGECLVAEPGMAMLLRPGDRLDGLTSRQIEGVSILVPGQRIRAGLPTLLHRGRADQALIQAGQRFAEVLASGPAAHQGELAAAELGAALESWQLTMEARQGGRPERITAIRRRQYVADGCLWMADHLEQPFGITELAQAVGVSARTLQYAFMQELGCTPMAEAKRQRLHRLRFLLQDSEHCSRSIAELMTASGLLACGATAIDYRQRFGESPRHSRSL